MKPFLTSTPHPPLLEDMWQPITDLPSDWEKLASSQIRALQPLWVEQSKKLQNSEVLRQFNDKLARQWAIETGYIERLYSIDQGITELLIERGIEASLIPHGSTDTSPERLVPILLDQKEALEGLFDFVKQSRKLSISYIKELHQLFARHQDYVEAQTPDGSIIQVELLKGDFKKLPNNPKRKDGTIHPYCPPEHVDAEMENLLTWHETHEKLSVPPEVESAWLHHRFTQIHPFQDGNGRIARALASLVYIRAGWFPLVIQREQRDNYIKCLETADSGDLKPLIKLFAGIQEKAFIRALSLSDSVLRDSQPVSTIITSGIEKLKSRFEQKTRELSRVFEHSSKLEADAEKRLGTIAREINKQLKSVNPQYVADAFRNTEANKHYYHHQLVRIAKEHEYFADTRTYRAWIRLKIAEDTQSDILITFHSLGHEFIGILVASAFIEFRDVTESDHTQIDGPYQLNAEVFQFTYNEELTQLRERFSQWLEECIIAGLDRWRSHL